MRLRIALALALAFTATTVGLAIDMSGAAPRLAGDDHVRWTPQYLLDQAPGGSTVCTRGLVLPGDAARLVMTIGSYNHPLPRISATFTSLTGRLVTTGALAPGATQGEEVPFVLRYPHGPDAGGTLCLHVAGHYPVIFGAGLYGAADAETTIGGQPQVGRIAILYYRPGREDWWGLLGALDLRIGLGKSSVFGDWTLPVIVLAALALWIGAARLLLRELR